MWGCIARHLKVLATYLGPAFAGYHPADFLRTTPRPRLSVQHVVGVDDPLGPEEATDGRMPLTEWIALAGYVCVLLNFTVVNLLFSGLHSYSGLK